MTSSISSLIPDIYGVIEGKGGWDDAVTKHLEDRLSSTLANQFLTDRDHGPYLRMSNIGTPCGRKLWYQINAPDDAETLPVYVRFNFLYGHVIEDLLLTLAEAAGHRVEGEQDVSVIDGIKGHRDCVIDGVLVDAKSASNAAFNKFQYHQLMDDDPFGYITQLSSYLLAGKDDDLIENKNEAAFFAANKNNGRMVVDMYDLRKPMERLPSLITSRKAMVKEDEPPERHYELKDYGKSGNKELPFECTRCEIKLKCYPDMRVFKAYKGPVYMPVVEREPKMDEITDEVYGGG